MKHRLISFCLLLMFSSAWAANQPAVMTVSSTKYNFGVFARKTVRRVVFPFVNTGKAPLVIKRAVASCGCTGVSYTKKPVLPGQTGYILVTYDGHGMPTGHFSKSVDVYSNASDNLVRFFIEGETR